MCIYKSLNKILNVLVFLLLLNASLAPCQAAESSKLDSKRIDELSQSKHWLRLLHYKPSLILKRVRSEVDGDGFFFSPKGRTDARAEMLATIAAFSKNIRIGNLKQHPQCAFPERYRFLKKELGLQTKDVECPQYREYLERFNPSSMTLVFSSAYPNNPGSMFGHTFLRINSKTKGGTAQEKLDLLDYGINFAAAVGPNENDFAFVWFGLTGGYYGQFAMVPYYVKVKEYSNSESRDLWEYTLDVSEEETIRLLSHVWELETNSHFDYYFFDENCSYQLLTLLEVAKTEWDLSDFGVHAIPAETIKRVARIPGAIREVHFRPSLRKRMVRDFEALSKDEKTVFTSLTTGEADPATAQDPAVLDAAINYFRYKRQRDDEKLSDDDQKILQALLTRRSKLGVRKNKEVVVERADAAHDKFRPELGHHPYRLSTATGISTGGRLFQELSFKFAYHDLLNSDVGYTPFSHIDFPWLTFRYNEGTGLRLERLDALGITSLFPLSFLEKRLSWKLEVNYASPKDLSCEGCHVAHAEAGAGATVNLASERAILYGLLLVNTDVGGAFSRSYRAGPKLQLATIANPLPRLKTRLAWNLVSDLWQQEREHFHQQVEWDTSWSFSQEFEIRTSVLSIFHPSTSFGSPTYLEGSVGLNYYF